MYLSDFEIMRPKYEGEQKHLLQWLSRAHTWGKDVRERKVIAELIGKVACSDSHVQKRGYSLADYSHTEFDNLSFFNFEKAPSGPGIKERMKEYNAIVDEVFQKFYPEEGGQNPDDLIHVTCTGYIAPSSAQKIVSLRPWLKGTVVTHAYHMGCMAAIPALRMGCGFLATSSQQVDIVHTEVSSLHMNPTLNTSEQIIAESLFADGFIKYSLKSLPQKNALQVLALHEEIIPNTEKLMEWVFEDWGMRMTLSKEIAVSLTPALPSFLTHLIKKAKLSLKSSECLFAIHPGGPKIIDQVSKMLHLKDEALYETRAILASFGNMSSGTMPHILEKMLKEREKEQIIIALAFGPGLTLTGALLKKV